MVTVEEQLIKAKLQRDRLRAEYESCRVRADLAKQRLDKFDTHIFSPLIEEQFRLERTHKTSQ